MGLIKARHGLAFSCLAYTLVTLSAATLFLSTGCSGSSKKNDTPAPTPPQVVVIPGTQTFNEGEQAFFQVNPTGNGPFTFQWLRGGKELPGSTQRSYTTPSLTLDDDSITYSVRVSNAAGSTESAVATLKVTPRLAITRQPAAVMATEGDTAVFSVQARGKGSLQYQWYADRTLIPGATAAELRVDRVTEAQSGTQYLVEVSSSQGSVQSQSAGLTVRTFPRIAGEPADATVQDGQPTAFTVIPRGTPPFTYQWLRNGAPIPGATQPTFTTQPLPYADNGTTYSVVVQNPVGQVRSREAKVKIEALAPTFTTQPQPVKVRQGTATAFNVAAVGTAPMTYQWFRNRLPLQGATGTTLAIPNAQGIDAATYHVSVTNPAGTVQSQSAILELQIPGTFSTQPQAQDILIGDTATFSVVMHGTGPFTYQWEKDGVELSGATAASLTVTRAGLTEAGFYRCRVKDGDTGTTLLSQAAQLSIKDLPLTITGQPTDQTVIAPAEATFRVTATGSNMAYQWAKNGTPISGANSPTFTTSAMDFQTEGGSYTVTLKSGSQTVTSTPATVVVKAPEPTYAGDPVGPMPLTVLPSMYSDPVRYPNGAFRFGYSEALKNPLWTAYAIFKVSAIISAPNRNWSADGRLQKSAVDDSDMGSHGNKFFYSGSSGDPKVGQGFDRGHMVPYADLFRRYHVGSTKPSKSPVADAACVMSNIVAQVSYHNQRVWQDLEQAIGGESATTGLTQPFGRVWVYTGPVFENPVSYWFPATEVYGTNPGAQPTDPTAPLAIAIPTALWKVVVAEPAPGQALPRIMAWMSSNRQLSDETLRNYTTSLKRVEELTGLTLLPQLKNVPGYDTWRASVDVRGFGADFEQAQGPNVHMVKPGWDLTDIAWNPVLKGHALKAGDTVAFEGAATPNSLTPTATLGIPTWTFKNGSTVVGNAVGLSTSYTFTAEGSYTVTFSVADSDGKANAITRNIQVGAGATPNQAPSFGTLSAVNLNLGSPMDTAFTVQDDITPADKLTLSVLSSSNAAVLAADQVMVANIAGTIHLTGTPLAAGTTTLALRLSDGSLTKDATVKVTVVDPNVSTAPFFGPISAQSATLGTPLTFTATVSDNTPAPGSIVVTATSSNPAVLPDSGIVVTNTNGTLSLTLTPLAAGPADVTLTANNGKQTGTLTFKVTVTDPNATPSGPALIISQYYGGVSYNKWIEITNVGKEAYDASNSPLYLGILSNPDPKTPGSGAVKVGLIEGTLAPGATVLWQYKDKSNTAVLPTTANITAVTTKQEATITNFNGDDPIFITPLNANTYAAWDARVDAFGAPSWGGGTLGKDTSFYRVPGSFPTRDHTDGQWVKKSMAEVEGAASDVSWRLGFHIAR